jgi:hypothetical protein
LISKNANVLFELAKEGNLQENLTVKRVLRSLSISWDDCVAEDLESLLLYHVAPRKINDPFYPSPVFQGEFEIGITQSHRIGVSRQQLTQGMLVVGRSGAGKTNLFYYLMRQCIDRNIPLLSIDLKKDYRHLIGEYPDLIVIPWEYLRFNPLKPPEGVAPIRWLQDFTEVFGHANALLSGSKDFVMMQLHKLYELYGVFEGSDAYPSMLEFQEILNKAKYSLVTKDARYLETVRNRVNATLLALNNVFDCSDGLPVSELLKRNVIIELDGLMEDFQNFIIEILLVWIYNYRLAQGHRGELRHCIFFDEAKRVFDVTKERRIDAGLPIIDILTDRAREFGEALIVADQEPTKLTDSIKANTLTKIMLSLGSGKDIEEMSRCMGLNVEQTSFSHKLGVGHGIARISGYEPLQIRIPQVEIRKDTTNESVLSRLMQNTAQFTISPRTTSRKFEEYLEQPTKKKETDSELSKDALQLLLDINENPLCTLSERYTRLGLSACKGNKAKNELKSRGYVKEEEVKTGEQGGRPKLLESTEKGDSHLLLNGHEPNGKNGKNGKGSLKHRYWQQKIKEFFEEWGCKAQVELFVGKKSVDVAIFCPNKKTIAVEIAMSPYYELENIRKDTEFGFDEVIVACKDECVRNAVETAFKRLFGGKPAKVRFCLLRQFNGSGEPLELDSTVSASQNKEINKIRNGPEDPRENAREDEHA